MIQILVFTYNSIVFWTFKKQRRLYTSKEESLKDMQIILTVGNGTMTKMSALRRQMS
jgi:hypothetical protein